MTETHKLENIEFAKLVANHEGYILDDICQEFLAVAAERDELQNKNDELTETISKFRARNRELENRAFSVQNKSEECFKANDQLSKDLEKLQARNNELIAQVNAQQRTETELKTRDIAQQRTETRLKIDLDKLSRLAKSLVFAVSKIKNPNASISDQVAGSQACWDLIKRIESTLPNDGPKTPAALRNVGPNTVEVKMLQEDGSYGEAQVFDRNDYEKNLSQEEIEAFQQICPKNYHRVWRCIDCKCHLDQEEFPDGPCPNCEFNGWRRDLL